MAEIYRTNKNCIETLGYICDNCGITLTAWNDIKEGNGFITCIDCNPYHIKESKFKDIHIGYTEIQEIKSAKKLYTLEHLKNYARFDNVYKLQDYMKSQNYDDCSMNYIENNLVVIIL